MGYDDLDLLVLVSDLVLDLDKYGNIVQFVTGGGSSDQLSSTKLIGKYWGDTVSDDSRPRVDSLLDDLGAGGPRVSWEEITQIVDDELEILLHFGIIEKADGQGWIAAGRDVGEIVGLKQQMLNAQMTLEHDYWRLRRLETRYRTLLNMVDHGVMVIDEESGRILEANEAADHILGDNKSKIVGKPFPIGFDKNASVTLKKFFAAVRNNGHGELDDILAADQKSRLHVEAQMLRQNEETRLLVSVSRFQIKVQTGDLTPAPKLDSILQSSPDAVVITDSAGMLLAANPMFLLLCQRESEAVMVGRNIGQWLGRTSVDLGVLLSNLRRHHQVKLFATSLKGLHGSFTDVEISAMQQIRDGVEYFIFFVRETSRRIERDNTASKKLPTSVAQITAQVGKMPLKGLVRQSTDVIEKMCIEAALELTDNNRASAAELLGLSRQSLYAKLRRYEPEGDDVAPVPEA